MGGGEVSDVLRWAPQWNEYTESAGRQRHIMWDKGMPLLFHTRRECRAWITRHYDFIRTRADLRAEPHGWRLPRAVRVNVSIVPVERELDRLLTDDARAEQETDAANDAAREDASDG